MAVRPIKPTPSSDFCEGEKIEARYRGKARFYPGKIRRENRDGTFEIDYDDGDKEMGVPVEFVRWDTAHFPYALTEEELAANGLPPLPKGCVAIKDEIIAMVREAKTEEEKTLHDEILSAWDQNRLMFREDSPYAGKTLTNEEYVLLKKPWKWRDLRSHEFYYQNAETGETVWEHPSYVVDEGRHARDERKAEEARDARDAREAGVASLGKQLLSWVFAPTSESSSAQAQAPPSQEEAPSQEERLEALGVSPSLLHRQASGLTREAVTAVLSDGSSGAEKRDATQQRELLEVIQDARRGQDQLALRTGERHALLRAVRGGASVDVARAQLQSALSGQQEADARSFEAASVHDAGRVHGRNILVQASTMLAARDVTGAMATCRALRKMLLRAVYTLDGFDTERATDVVVEKAMRLFPFVTSVDLRGCDSLRHVTAWPATLTSVNVKDCGNLTDATIKIIANQCPKLARLIVENCRNVTYESIIAIANQCPKLAELNVGGFGGWMVDGLTDESFIAIAHNCHGLTKLNTTNLHDLSDDAIIAIAHNCPKLVELSVSENMKLSNVSIIAIAHKCPALAKLDVSGCYHVTDEAIIAIAHHCHHLVELSVGGFNGPSDEDSDEDSDNTPLKDLSDESIIAIAHHCPNLTTLDVLGSSALTDEAIIAIANSCPNLTKLDVNECSGLSDKSIIAIANSCPNLTELGVMECFGLSDMSIIAIAHHCPNLITLDVSQCYHVTDVSIIAIANWCPNLARLGMENCPKISDVSIIAIANSCTNLAQLCIGNCPQISDKAINHLKERFPGLDVGDSEEEVGDSEEEVGDSEGTPWAVIDAGLLYTETANAQQAEDEIPAHWRSLPRTYAKGDRVQACLEDNSKVRGVVKRVYVKSSNGNPVGKYKVSWEGDMDEMDVSDAESDNLELHEGNASHGFFFCSFR